MCQFLPSYRYWMLPLICLLSLGLRIEHRYFYRNVYLDTEVQLASAQSWLNGTGFAYRYVEDDLSEVQTRSGHIFMPGYVAAVIPAYLLLDDWFDAAFAIDVLSLLCLYLGLLWTWREIEGDKPTLLWLLIFIGISPAPLHYLMASGLLAISLFSLSLAALLQAIREDRSRLLMLSIVFAIMASSTRSAYVPLMFSLPLILFVQGWLMKKKSLRSWAVQSFLVLCCVFIGIQWLKSGDESFFDTMTSAWYPAHLLKMEPFVFKTFFYFGVPHEVWLQSHYPLLFRFVKGIAYVSSFSIVIVFSILSKQILWQDQSQTLNKTIGPWIVSSWIVAGINVSMLVMLSLKVPAETWNWQGFWTFVMEPRYYMPSMWGILIVCFYIAGTKRPLFFQQWLKIFLIVATIAACSYPLYLKYRIHIQNQRQGTFVEDPRQAWIRHIRSHKHRPQSLILTSSTNTHIGEMIGAITLPWDMFHVDKSVGSDSVVIWGLTLPEEMPMNAVQIDMVKAYVWWELK